VARRGSLVFAGVLGAAGVLAAGGLAGYQIAASQSPAAARPAHATAKPFTDASGLVVFEEQPSGQLGTARPDGTRVSVDSALTGLQGNDLPVAAPDGQRLADQQGELVTVGANGPTAVSRLGTADPAAAAGSASGGAQWPLASFANGGADLAVTECDPVAVPNGGASPYSEWVSWLVPVSGGKPVSLGLTAAATAMPGADSVLAALPANPAAARQQITCAVAGFADSVLDLLSPGQRPKPVATAAALTRAAGLAANTPVTIYPGAVSPDGRWAVVRVAQVQQNAGPPTQRQAPAPGTTLLVNVATGHTARLPRPGEQLAWSPDGTRLASCLARQGAQSTVTVWPVSAAGQPGAARTISLGRHDAFCDQLLWSPDGTQLMYSGMTSARPLTYAAGLQRGWTVIDLRTRAVHNVTAPGQPAAWIKGTGA